jgi:hypothetical protein
MDNKCLFSADIAWMKNRKDHEKTSWLAETPAWSGLSKKPDAELGWAGWVWLDRGAEMYLDSDSKR